MRSYAKAEAASYVSGGTRDTARAMSLENVEVVRLAADAMAQRGLDAFAAYCTDDIDHRALALDVLRIERGLIVEITSFASPEILAIVGLPQTLGG